MRERKVSIGLDFDEHVGIDQLCDLHHGGRRPDGSEELAVRAADFLPSTDVGDVDACPHDIVESSTSLLQRGLDIAQCLERLRAHVALPDDSAVGIGSRRAGHVNVGADAHRSGVADHRLPRPAAGDVLPHGTDVMLNPCYDRLRAC